jgi:hypothetical protein
MAKDRGDYIITYHLRERFVQRINKKYDHLQNCRSEQCYNCDALRLDIKGEIGRNRQAIDTELHRRLGEAEEDRSYLNNSGFMQWYYDKYGYDKGFEFLVHDKILFVVVHDCGKKVVVTCVSAKTHYAGKCLLAKPKFNKIKKKEEKLLESAAAT